MCFPYPLSKYVAEGNPTAKTDQSEEGTHHPKSRKVRLSRLDFFVRVSIVLSSRVEFI